MNITIYGCSTRRLMVPAVPAPTATTRRGHRWQLGVVPVLAWRPDAEPPAELHSAYYWARIGCKP
jgi:hypothetical protein